MFTKEEFVRRSKVVHGLKYDYSKSDYKGSMTKLVISCPVHGDFLQEPASHWRGCGCRRCAGLEPGTTDGFITQAREVHHGRYFYDSVKYAGSKCKVVIGCPKHGYFTQTPNNHLRGQGCPCCFDESRSLSQEDFVIRCKKVHRNKYGYDKCDYKHNIIPVIVTCPKHGDFRQLPLNHLYGHCGCPTCKSSKGEIRIHRFLERRGLKFQSQFRFPDCKNQYMLRFDFAVFTNSGLILIEYQGQHHYRPVSFGGTSRAKTIHRQTVKRDQIKRAYCDTHGYKLIEVPFNCSGVEKFLSEVHAW